MGTSGDSVDMLLNTLWDKSSPLFGGGPRYKMHDRNPQVLNSSFEDLANLVRFPRPYYYNYLFINIYRLGGRP